MEWLNRMMDAIDLIERRIAEKTDIQEIARAAYSSPFHFQRMFYMLTGFTVAEYVRRRKLTLAAQELASSQARVLDVALKYGYESPEAFSKAFRRAHGISPSEARSPGAALKAFPRISFQLSLKGDAEMEYRIVEKGVYRAIGTFIQTSTCEGQNLTDISAFWRRANADGTARRLAEAAPGKDLLGICTNMDDGSETLDYWIAAESEAEAEGWAVLEIPAATWAVFPTVGPMPGAIQKTWQRIFQEWFPSTGYEHAGGVEIEVYPEGDTNAEDYRCEVWVPIVKK